MTSRATGAEEEEEADADEVRSDEVDEDDEDWWKSPPLKLCA